MKLYLVKQQGFILIELMIGMTLSGILLVGMFSLFFTSLTAWAVEKNRITTQQTIRIATDTIVREVRYAQNVNLTNPRSLTITQLNGETIIFQLGGGVHQKTLYMIIDKTHAIPVGGTSANPITENVVTDLQFAIYSQPASGKAIGISMEVSNQNTGVKQTLSTVVYPLNMH